MGGGNRGAFVLDKDSGRRLTAQPSQSSVGSFQEPDIFKENTMLMRIGCAVLVLASLAAAKDTSDEQAIRKMDADWSAAAQAKDADKASSFYADDATFLPENAPKVEGKAQIRAAWANMLATPGLSVSFGPTKIEISKSGDVAYDIGTTEVKTTDAQGSTITAAGKYVVVWRKQADKQWKVVADIFNSDK